MPCARGDVVVAVPAGDPELLKTLRSQLLSSTLPKVAPRPEGYIDCTGVPMREADAGRFHCHRKQLPPKPRLLRQPRSRSAPMQTDSPTRRCARAAAAYPWGAAASFGNRMKGLSGDLAQSSDLWCTGAGEGVQCRLEFGQSSPVSGGAAVRRLDDVSDAAGVRARRWEGQWRTGWVGAAGRARNVHAPFHSRANGSRSGFPRSAHDGVGVLGGQQGLAS
jgi:hypothetical protein